jgi:hypothetical protein
MHQAVTIWSVTFDCRGWGASAAKMLPLGDPPQPDAMGGVTIRARAVRGVVDPFDQIRDIANCLDFLEGEPQADPTVSADTAACGQARIAECPTAAR